jgi:hypothetical protein
MPKKNLIEEALIEAKELERATFENAKDIVLESFTPDFVNFFKDVLSEGDDVKDKDYDEDDPKDKMKNESDMDDEDDPDYKAKMKKEGDMPDFIKKKMKGKDDDDSLDESDDNDEDDDPDYKEMKKEGNEHDGGKYPDPGRQGTDPAVDDDEEAQNQDMKEGKFDDVSGDATPEKGQAGLPKKGQPKTKKVGDSGWEDEGTAGYAADDPEKSPGDLPGKKPAVKQTGKGGWEDEGASGAEGDDPEKGGKNGLNVPTPPVKMVEADKDDDDNEKLDVPEELFKEDEDKEMKGKDKDDDVDLGDDDDVEINIDVDDDSKSVKEADDKDMDYDKKDEEDDEIDEGLYIRQEGRFKKITPAEYLQTRIDTLEEERNALSSAVDTLQGQLQETHLFNAKLAHLNKLYMSGAFTNSEKERIAERLDECDDISDVKSLYKTIISEVQDTNPLDDFSTLIKEQRLQRSGKTENIYESNDVGRMKRIMNYEFE